MWQPWKLTCLLVITLSVIKITLSSSYYQHTIAIDPDVGKDGEKCISNSSKPCQTLAWAFSPQYRRNSTVYLLSEGHHILDRSTDSFEGMSDLAFVGASSNVVIHCTADNSGLAFREVSEVCFESLTFFNCSALRYSTSTKHKRATNCYEMYQTRVALYFYLCSNVSMVRVNVSHSPDATGVIMYNTNGVNYFQNSTFEYNQLSAREATVPAGGGFYVEFTYCIPTSGDCICKYDNFSDIPAEIARHNSNATYSFEKCEFKNNIAKSVGQKSSQNSSNYIIPYKQSHMAFGRGGGLSIMFKGNASGNRFIVSDCIFRDNRAIWGGGLLVSFMGISLDNALLVTDSSFLNNKCIPPHKESGHGTGGGGMRIGHNILQTLNLRSPGNRVTLNRSHFDGNHALSGGGVSVSPALQLYSKYLQLITVNITLSTFTHNTARIGFAIEVTLFPIFVRGGVPRVYISYCNFTTNRNSLLSEGTDILSTETGVGAVYSNGVILHFIGNVRFEKNHGSALAVVRKRVSFENCSAEFVGNSGRVGGAINLLGVSYLLVNDKTVMKFVNNSAEVYGGAINNKYIERENVVTNPNCFVRHIDPFHKPNKWGTKFFFEDNHGGLFHKDTIHTTSILPCAWPGWGGAGNASSILCGRNWVYLRHNRATNCDSEIRTGAGSIDYTPLNVGNVSECSTASLSTRSHSQHSSLSQVESQVIEAVPGKPFELPLLVRDDLCHNISTTTVFAARVVDSEVSQVDPRFVYTSGGYLQLNGVSDNMVELHLDTINDRTWHVELHVRLLPCPPGFVLSNDTPRKDSTCVCNSQNYQKRLRCEQSDFHAFLRNGYWIGTTPESNGSLVVSLCLPGYCTTNDSADYVMLPDELDSQDKVCVNRVGVLCGQCVPEYGPAVNRRDFRCVLCNATNIAAHATYYVLSVYLPLFILFTGIIVFNVRLTTGPANAFILYSQIIASTFDLTGDNHIPLNVITSSTSALLAAYRIPYGVFNLDFLENFVKPLCLGSGLNSLDALQLDYIVAMFPLLMILLVLLVLSFKSRCGIGRLFHMQRHQALHDYTSVPNHSPTEGQPSRRLKTRKCLCRWFRDWQAGESLLHAFSAFLLLSYTKFALTSSYIVNLHPILSADGSQVGPRRAYYAGYFTEHDPLYLLRYYIPSCLVIVIISILPIMLLGYPIIWLEKCLYKVEWLWRWYPVTKIHIFMDTFQGCYRDDRRFFAAVYFLFRLTINVGYILTDTWLQQFVVQQIACTVFIVIFVLCWPYREEKWIFNYVDFLMLTNLAIVNALSLYLFAFSQTNHSLPLPTSAFVFQYILVFLPLMYMLLYVVWCVLKPTQKEKIAKFVTKMCGNVKQKTRQRGILRQTSTPSSNAVTVDTPTSNTDHSTLHVNTVRPTIVSSTDLEFLDEEIFSDIDEEEAMLVRARGRNRYKPPKEKTREKDCHNGSLNRSVTEPPIARRADVGHLDCQRGSKTEVKVKREEIDVAKQSMGEPLTKDSGFASGTRDSVSTTASSQLPHCKLSRNGGEDGLGCETSLEQDSSSQSLKQRSKDYGTMCNVDVALNQ